MLKPKNEEKVLLQAVDFGWWCVNTSSLLWEVYQPLLDTASRRAVQVWNRNYMGTLHIVFVILLWAINDSEKQILLKIYKNKRPWLQKEMCFCRCAGLASLISLCFPAVWRSSWLLYDPPSFIKTGSEKLKMEITRAFTWPQRKEVMKR